MDQPDVAVDLDWRIKVDQLSEVPHVIVNITNRLDGYFNVAKHFYFIG